jgi:divalent metal cation (Fe/Co/Zn/Cd) transporter
VSHSKRAQDWAHANLIQCRAYHAGQNYYVEVDIVMDEDLPLKITHDVSQTLQRKLEGMCIYVSCLLEEC